MVRAWRGKHWRHTRVGTGGTCRKEPPNPSRAVGNCPDGRRILHIVAQMAPEARNRTGPDKDAEPRPNAPSKAVRTQIRHARQDSPPLPCRLPQRAGLRPLRRTGAEPPGLAHPSVWQPHHPPARKRTSAPKGRNPPAARCAAQTCPPRPVRRPCLFRLDEYDNDACLGHGHPHPPRSSAATPGGERTEGQQPPPKARSPYPQCPAAGLHTGPVHRPC